MHAPNWSNRPQAAVINGSPQEATVLRRLSLSRKLALAVAIPLLLFVVSTAVTFAFVNRVKVNGPEYAKVVDAKDLVADILPPPNYLVETHLIAAQILRSTPEEFAEKKAKLESLRTEYDTRNKVWVEKLTDPQLRSAFLEESFTPARQYQAALFNDFLPAMERAYANGWTPDESGGGSFVLDNDYSAADEIFNDQLEPLYAQHKVAIDKTVVLARAAESKIQSDAADTVSMATILTIGVAALGFVLTALAGVFVTRAVRRPVLKLTAAANLAATESLPRIVAEAQTASADTVLSLPEVDVDSEDELGELAKAFTQMQNTAVSLATEQAKVRRNVSENLVNLARRNQALLGRSLALLTKLEQDERDPDKLDELFRVDHLTTRMRRNAESLLVLAGTETVRTWSEPVEIGDVVRAAVSAIESYDRVEIAGLESVKVRGTAVSDVAHLLAELMENATAFSAPTTTVSVIGKYRPDGYLIVVSDDGIGMTPEEIALANQRVSEFSAFDATPTKVLGLNVVGRLGGRHGIEVSLGESPTAGTSARVLLPMALLEVVEGAFSVSDAAASAPAAAESDHDLDDRGTLPTDLWGTDATVGAAEMPMVADAAASSNVRELRPSGLAKRVRGAQLPDTGPAHSDEPHEEVSPEAVMGSLASFQGGLERGRRAETELDAMPVESDAIDAFSAPADWSADGWSADAVETSETPGTPEAAEAAESAGSVETASMVDELDPTEDAAEAPAVSLSDWGTSHAIVTSADVEAALPTPTAPDLHTPSPSATTPAGLTRRVRGAQMPDTGPDRIDSAPFAAEPELVRSSLASLQQGVSEALRQSPAESPIESPVGGE